MQLFAAIDFETASSERNSACAIGYVIFNHKTIIKKKSFLKMIFIPVKIKVNETR